MAQEKGSFAFRGIGCTFSEISVRLGIHRVENGCFGLISLDVGLNFYKNGLKDVLKGGRAWVTIQWVCVLDRVQDFAGGES